MSGDPFQYNHFIFDLDDTLYSEIDYLYVVYRQMAEEIHAQTGFDTETIAQALIGGFLENGRSQLLNKVLRQFELNEVEWLPRLLRIMRTGNVNNLKLRPLARKTLLELTQRGKQILVLTNGNVSQQKNKVEGLAELTQIVPASLIYYANEHKPKPSPAAFKQMTIDHGLDPYKSIMIGDSDVDEQFARNAGISFINEKLFFDLCAEYLD